MSNTNLQTSVSQKLCPSAKDGTSNILEVGSLIPDRHGGTPFFTRRSMSVTEMEKRRMYLDKIRIGHLHVRGSLTSEVRIPERFNGVYSMRFSPEREEFVTGYGSGSIQIRGIDGEVVGTVRSSIGRSYAIMAIRYHTKDPNIFYAASASGVVFRCSSNNGNHEIFFEEVGNEINALDVNSTGEIIASAGKDATIRTYETETATYLESFPINSELSSNKFHSMRIFSLKFHPEKSHLLVSGGWDGTVKVWDIRHKDGCVRSINGPHVCGDAIDIFNNSILTGSWIVKYSLQKWDIGSGKLIDTIVPTNRPTSIDGEFLYCAQFFDGDPTGDTVISAGSGTGCVEVISVREKKVMASFRAYKAVQALHSKDISIAYGGMETMVRVAEFI